MTADEMAEWKHWNEEAGNGRTSSPCRDCRKSFALVQRAMGICVGRYPGERVLTVMDRVRARLDAKGISGRDRQRAMWQDPEYRAPVMARRAASDKPVGAAAHGNRHHGKGA